MTFSQEEMVTEKDCEGTWQGLKVIPDSMNRNYPFSLRVKTPPRAIAEIETRVNKVHANETTRAVVYVYGLTEDRHLVYSQCYQPHLESVKAQLERLENILHYQEL